MKLKYILIPIFLCWMTFPISKVGAQTDVKALVYPTVQKIRALYPPMVDPAQIGDMLNQIAWRLNVSSNKISKNIFKISLANTLFLVKQPTAR